MCWDRESPRRKLRWTFNSVLPKGPLFFRISPLKIPLQCTIVIGMVREDEHVIVPSSSGYDNHRRRGLVPQLWLIWPFPATWTLKPTPSLQPAGRSKLTPRQTHLNNLPPANLPNLTTLKSNVWCYRGLIINPHIPCFAER